VAETARTINHAAGVHPALGFSRPVSGRLPGVSLLLAGPFGQAHYHFLWDLLGKLALWPAPLRRSVDHFLVGVPPSPGITDWLRAAQVPLERVTWLTGGSHLLCEQLIFSSLPCEVNQPRPEVVRALRTLFPSSGPAEASRWLWISRQGQSQRDLRWEDQILTALPRFERLDLGALPAREQIRAFAAAGVVAGPHGSGLANLAFVHGAGDLIEFFPEDSPEDPLFGRIAAVVGWRHAWARCNFAQPHAAGAVIAALRHRLAGK
jgi:capsular polysaccharide biosynthesis protein